MKYSIVLAAMVIMVSCTAVKVSVPSSFSNEATRMHVQGINGWQVNQKLSFGDYKTSSIKRGWDFTASIQWTKFRISPEEMIARVFDITTDKGRNIQRGKFQYLVESGNLMMEVFATEKFEERQLVYKSNNPYIGNFSKTNRYEYAFSAAILPISPQNSAPWSLVLINKYDVNKDTARRLFDRPYVEEEGYATNGTENITIRPLRLDKVTTKSGKETKVFGGSILTGYELKWDNGVVAVIDIMDNNIWIVNDLDPKEKLLLASISSAIMLKRMQDVEKDRDRFDQ